MTISKTTITGNLVADPELRYTKSGTPVVSLRIASTPRRYDKQAGQFVDGEALFIDCNIWRQAAENAASSLNKGDSVIVTGNLRQRSFETREGQKRDVVEIEVDDFGPSLKRATAQVTKGQPASGGQPQQPAQQGFQQAQNNMQNTFGSMEQAPF